MNILTLRWVSTVSTVSTSFHSEIRNKKTIRDNKWNYAADSRWRVSRNLPALHHIRRTIRSQRQTNGNIPPCPGNIAAIPILPVEYQITLSCQQFLLYNSGVGDQSRIFIFDSPDGVSLLQQSGYWFCDDTFKVVPEIFYQQFILYISSPDPTFSRASKRCYLIKHRQRTIDYFNNSVRSQTRLRQPVCWWILKKQH